jgi:hypothetical protein
MHLWSFGSVTNVSKTYVGDKTDSSANGARISVYSPGRTLKLEPRVSLLFKKKFKMY